MAERSPQDTRITRTLWSELERSPRRSMEPVTAFKTLGTFGPPLLGPFEQFYVNAGKRQWWREEMQCGHDILLDMPSELAKLLLQRL